MKITNPQEYLKLVDSQRLKQLLAKSTVIGETAGPAIEYVEPAESQQEQAAEISAADDSKTVPDAAGELEEINGKIQRLGDFVDTDAVWSCSATIVV